MNSKDSFLNSCNSASSYPKNLVCLDTYNHVADTYIERLNQDENRLLSVENKSDVELWEYGEKSKGFVSTRVNKNVDLQSHLTGVRFFEQIDPRCRFMFIHALHSRERLKITRIMLMFAFTYHQVMATFIDFLFSFGKQDYPVDFHFCGFRHETRLSTGERGLQLDELGRSGQDFMMGYNLKSVESSKSQPHWPWSIRQAAIYHSFDVGTGNAFWTVIKGDDLINKRIKESTNHDKYPNLDLESSVSNSFSASLAAQIIIVDWCGESWRWYIKHLEEVHEQTTRRALITSFDRPNLRNVSPLRRSVTSPPGSSIKRTVTRLVQRVGSATGTLPPPIPLSTRSGPVVPPPDFELDPNSHENFSFQDFHDLQTVQFYEEKVSEVLLVLESNMNILTNMKDYYADLVSSADFPPQIRVDCADQITRFNKRIISIVNDLKMQHSRAKMLLSTITTRTGLLNGILNYRSMEANKIYTEKTQASTTNMEELTKEMNVLAQKTKQETVSMRIITLVTLFFLPGTFISTIMSTDIVQYTKDPTTGVFEENYSSRALDLYLKITLPMMAATFVAWYIVYWWTDRKQNVKAIKERLKMDLIV